MEKELEIRNKAKAKKPKFTMQDSHKKGKLKEKWRKPRGIDSKMRLHLKGYRRSPSKGYKSPAAVKGYSRDGLAIVPITRMADLEKIGEKEAGLLSGKIGARKKVEIVKKAIEKNIILINMKKPQEFVSKIEIEISQKKETKKKKEETKKKKEKEKEKKAKEKEKEKAEEKDELASKVEEEEKKEQEKKEMDKTLIHTE